MGDQNTAPAAQLKTQVETLRAGGAPKVIIGEYLRGVHLACIHECFKTLAALVAKMPPQKARAIIVQVLQIVKEATQEVVEDGA